MEELNDISKEEKEKYKDLNTLPNYKSNEGDSSKVYVKDRIGVWTEKQIEENPIAYLEYLRNKLENNVFRQDVSDRILLEIKRVERKYLPNDYAIGRNK